MCYWKYASAGILSVSMRTVNFTLASVAVAVVSLLMGLPMLAQAQSNADGPADPDIRRDPADRWISSLAIHSGITIQDWKGAADSTLFPGPGAADPSPVPIRPPKSDSNLDVSPVVGLSLELMTPELRIPLRPRIVIGAELIPIFGFERAIARRGDPGVLKAPLQSGVDPSSIRFDEDKFIGQGTKVTGEMGDIAWGAYLGLSFPFELFDRSIRIKPNISWLRYETDFKGFVSDAECVNPALFGKTDCNAPLSSVRTLSLKAQTSQVYHAIGPGLDIEMDTTVFDGIGSSIFLGFRAYRVLGNHEEVRFEVSETFDDEIGTGDVANARFTTEVDEWIYRLIVGFRVELQGFFD